MQYIKIHWIVHSLATHRRQQEEEYIYSIQKCWQQLQCPLTALTDTFIQIFNYFRLFTHRMGFIRALISFGYSIISFSCVPPSFCTTKGWKTSREIKLSKNTLLAYCTHLNLIEAKTQPKNLHIVAQIFWATRSRGSSSSGRSSGFLRYCNHWNGIKWKCMRKLHLTKLQLKWIKLTKILRIRKVPTKERKCWRFYLSAWAFIRELATAIIDTSKAYFCWL